MIKNLKDYDFEIKHASIINSNKFSQFKIKTHSNSKEKEKEKQLFIKENPLQQKVSYFQKPRILSNEKQNKDPIRKNQNNLFPAIRGSRKKLSLTHTNKTQINRIAQIRKSIGRNDTKNLVILRNTNDLQKNQKQCALQPSKNNNADLWMANIDEHLSKFSNEYQKFNKFQHSTRKDQQHVQQNRKDPLTPQIQTKIFKQSFNNNFFTSKLYNIEINNIIDNSANLTSKVKKQTLNILETYKIGKQLLYENKYLIYNCIKKLQKIPELFYGLFGKGQEHISLNNKLNIQENLKTYMNIKCLQCYERNQKLKLLRFKCQNTRQISKVLEYLIRDPSKNSLFGIK